MDGEARYPRPDCRRHEGTSISTTHCPPYLIIYTLQYTTNSKTGDLSIQNRVNYAGNGTKSMRISVEASLKRLRTTYIDLLYVHWWDYDTSIREVMDSLHALVMSGKVLYLGISDTPAWVVAQANQYALDHGKTPFSVYQGHWNVLDRDFERDIIPMARAHGMALAPWAVLGGGKLRTDADEKKREESGEQQRTFYGPEWKRTETEAAVSRALEKVAADVGAKSITSGTLSTFCHAQTFAHLEMTTSRYRLRDAEGALCVPYHRWTKGRASEGESRGVGN